ATDAPGHTIAHYSLLAEPEGREAMIFAGDAAYTNETLERMIIGGFHLDPTESISALKRIKQVAKENEAEIFVSHDMEPWNSWKHAPEFYGA
ncbi:MAG: N-acyl homoserine lactonase family protein, partial [Chloroflexota bacterium]